MKKTTLIFLLAFMLILFLGKQGHAQNNENKDDLWNIALSNDCVFSNTPCYSIKVEVYGFLDKIWKREAKDRAKSNGKNAYLHFNLSFFNALRYNLYFGGVDGSTQLMGDFAWSIMSSKFFLCFPKHPRFMTNFNFSVDIITSNYNFGLSYGQYFYYYLFGRCALGVGAGGYVVFESRHSQLNWLDGYPYLSVQLFFDI